jgi:hypothetical protein
MYHNLNIKNMRTKTVKQISNSQSLERDYSPLNKYVVRGDSKRTKSFNVNNNMLKAEKNELKSERSKNSLNSIKNSNVLKIEKRGRPKGSLNHNKYNDKIDSILSNMKKSLIKDKTNINLYYQKLKNKKISNNLLKNIDNMIIMGIQIRRILS